ncbi:helix-turn-helix domain-containing protein [Faecalibacterium sp.]
MDGQEKLLDYETIKAAVAGEKWATEKVLTHYHLLRQVLCLPLRPPQCLP